MARSIKLTITEPKVVTMGSDTGYYVKFKLTEAVEMPEELFVFRILPKSPADPDGYTWSHVASPPDLEEYPVGTASVIYSDFFRRSEAEFLFKTTDLMSNTIADMQSRLADVKAKLDLLDTLILYKEIPIEV